MRICMYLRMYSFCMYVFVLYVCIRSVCIYVCTSYSLRRHVCVCTCAYVYIFAHMCMRIYMYCVSTFTGWRKLIGSPKLQIIFHKRATKYRSLSREMTYKNKGSYESSPPYICFLCMRVCAYVHMQIFASACICVYATYRHMHLIAYAFICVCIYACLHVLV